MPPSALVAQIHAGGWPNNTDRASTNAKTPDILIIVRRLCANEDSGSVGLFGCIQCPKRISALPRSSPVLRHRLRVLRSLQPDAGDFLQCDAYDALAKVVCVADAVGIVAHLLDQLPWRQRLQNRGRFERRSAGVVCAQQSGTSISGLLRRNEAGSHHLVGIRCDQARGIGSGAETHGYLLAAGG